MIGDSPRFKSSDLGSLCLAIIGVLLSAFAVTGVTYAASFPAEIVDSSNPVSLQLTGSWTGTARGTLNGEGVYWYTGYGFSFTYQGTTYNEPTSYCVDPSDGTTGSVPSYFIESLSSSSGTQYLEAAWLANQVMLGNLSTVTAQVAMWKIIFNGNGNTYTFVNDSIGDSASTIENWVTLAQNNYQNLNLAGFYLATSPTNSPSTSFGVKYQDYLFYDGTPSQVPVPNTLFIFGTALLGLIGIRRRVRI